MPYTINLPKENKLQFWLIEMEQEGIPEEAGQIDHGLACQNSVVGSSQLGIFYEEAVES